MAKNSINSKRLLFVTGTRADYSKLEPLAKVAHEAGFKITFYITGMHLLRKYGMTNLEVKRFKGADHFEYVNQREGDKLDSILAKTVIGFSDYVHENRPDLVIIHGDRIESLAASIVCATNYIPSAHIEGGEVSGTIDEVIRHCNSKLNNAHFVSCDAAKKNVVALGESEDRVYVIGSPELDVHLLPSGISIQEVKQHYGIEFSDYGVAIFHPVTSETETIASQADILFSALEESKKCFVVIAPNNDPGSREIFDVIEKLPKERFRILPSMRFNCFSELLKNCSLFIGNSSAGVREAPFLGIQSLNIGTRQYGRSISSSVSHCNPVEKSIILKFINDKWGVKIARCNGYGLGDSRRKFMEIISDPLFWNFDKQKFFNS